LNNNIKGDISGRKTILIIQMQHMANVYNLSLF